MSIYADKTRDNKKQSVASETSQVHAGLEPAYHFEDNRPEAVAQRKLRAITNNRPQVKQLSKTQDLINNYSISQLQPLQKKEKETGSSKYVNSRHSRSSNPIIFKPARNQSIKPSVPKEKGVIQAKMFFAPNKHYLADPNDIAIHSIDQYQQWFTAAVAALPDNADAAAARGAVNAEFAHRHLNVVYRLNWVGNDVFLETNTGQQLEDLGSVKHDQEPGLYVPHPVVGGQDIQVNRSDRSQKVRDSSGQYMERFVKRSLAHPDLANLQGQNDLRGPNENDRTTLDHVTGINDGDFLSFSTDQNDVMNAHGEMFNAQQRGRVEVDLARMNANNINNLSTRRGIRENLYPQLGQYAQSNIDQIMDDGEQRSAAERLAGPAPALVAGDHGANRRTAGQNNPHGNLRNIHYQAITDAFRTKEVLLEGAVPFNSITEYNANGGGHGVGAQVTAAIAGNLNASQTLTQAADQTLTDAEQIPATPISPVYQNELPRIRHRLSALMNMHFKDNKARTGANIHTRNKQFKTTLKTEKNRMNNEALQLAELYQRRNNTNWPNSTQANFRTRLQVLLTGAVANFAAYQP